MYFDLLKAFFLKKRPDYFHEYAPCSELCLPVDSIIFLTLEGGGDYDLLISNNCCYIQGHIFCYSQETQFLELISTISLVSYLRD